MKKQITLLGILLIAATVTLTMGFRNNDNSTLGKLISVPQKEQTEVIKAVNQIIALHNSNKTRLLHKIFSSGNTPSQVWKMAGQKDPVTQSLDALQECGKS